MSCYMIIISVLLMTAVNVRAQCERPFVGENRILMDETDQQTFPDGSTVKFKCSIGYTVAGGVRTITCNGTEWSKLELKCKKKTCGHPGDIMNGKYLLSSDGVLFGAIATAVCNDGYQLVGKESRTCRENGWDGRRPVCEAVKCEKPLPITNGMFEPEEDIYNYGEVITYSCRRDFDLIGHSEITCSSNGFHPSPPQCRIITCERPDIQNAIRVEGKSPPYKYRHFVRYQCMEGYRMEGADYLTCKENGWDPPPPRCNVITCPKPAAIRNGTFVPQKDVYVYREIVTFFCNKCFKLEGHSTASCTVDGLFEIHHPECKEVTCKPPNIPHLVVSGSSQPYKCNTSVQVSCVKGYRIQGPDYLTCGEHGWNSPLPQCTEIFCEPPNIPHSTISIISPPYRWNVSVRVTCDKGYRIQGPDYLTCGENGWTPPPPKCNIVTCVPPPEIFHGEFTPVKNLYEYKQTLTYSCEEGFILHGDRTISCTDEGIFQPSPQCLVVNCSAPQIKNGFIDGNSEYYDYKSKIQVQCNTGFKIEGSIYLTCEEDGWSSPPPDCHFSLWLVCVIVLVLLVFLLAALVVYKRSCKQKKPKVSNFDQKPENCSLVSMNTHAPVIEASSSKNVVL